MNNKDYTFNLWRYRKNKALYNNDISALTCGVSLLVFLLVLSCWATIIYVFVRFIQNTCGG